MSTEMCDFVKLVLDRMDTNPQEFIEGDPTHRWGTLVRGIVDWVVGETDTSSARSLWALEPHELEAVTTESIQRGLGLQPSEPSTTPCTVRVRSVLS